MPSKTSEFAVETQLLGHTYGTFVAVDSLNLRVRRGQIFALLGPNGAGKSTTIQILTTLRTPTSGKAYVAGFNVAQAAREVRRRVGVVFQEPCLDDRLTARENLELHAAIYGVPSKERSARTDEHLEGVGLAPLQHQLVRTFSGGMRRRLEIARALMHRPEILILDEPTVGLDSQTRRSVWDYMRTLTQDGERTVFVTTHYMDEAETCDEVAVIDHGKLVAQGSPSDLVALAGSERLLLTTTDDERALQVAQASGYRTHKTHEGVEVEGERAETMLAHLAEKSLGITRIVVIRPKLEDAFVSLTGQGLRDTSDDSAGNYASMRTQFRARGGR